MRFFTRQQILNKATEVRRRMYYNKSASVILNEQAGKADTATFDIFLSHSYQDADLILGLMKILEEELRLTVYVDWVVDNQLDRSRVNRQTADKLRRRMKNCRSLFFATSKNTSDSKWMPWELGYFDGIKGKVAVCPVLDVANASSYDGQEYLGLYPYVAMDVTHISRGENVFVIHPTGARSTLGEWLRS